MSLTSSALRDVERPRLAKFAASGHYAEIRQSIRTVQWLLVGMWLLCGIAVALLFILNPRVLFPPSYDMHTILIGAVLWWIVGGLAMVRVPESILLQAIGNFRAMALANVLAAITSVVAVATLVMLVPPISILGILAGQSVIAVAIGAQTRRWRRENMDTAG